MAIEVIVLIFDFRQVFIEGCFFSQKVSDVRLSFVALILDCFNGFCHIGIFSSLSVVVFSGQSDLAFASFLFHFKQFVGSFQLFTFDLTFSNLIFPSAVVLKQLLRIGLGISDLLTSNLGFFGQMLNLDLEFEAIFGSKLKPLMVGNFGQLLR